MKIEILSRKAVEDLIDSNFPKNTAVISFYDPPTSSFRDVLPPVNYKGKTEQLFYIPLLDIDREILCDFGLTMDTYFPEVERLAKFIYYAYNENMNILCQCEYGQSRSAACAAAIAEHFYHKGIEIFADYRYYPNQLVYHKIKDALEGEEQQ